MPSPAVGGSPKQPSHGCWWRAGHPRRPRGRRARGGLAALWAAGLGLHLVPRSPLGATAHLWITRLQKEV